MAKRGVNRAAERERAFEVCRRLKTGYPKARCTLDFESPLELLVATILAAQCTDERVNIVTKDLFAKYRTARDYAEAPEGELEEAVRSCGFYRQKAASIRKTCAALIERFGGRVPSSMEDLTSLDGVGRKTANVLLGECFDTPGIIVDTHCKRLSNRLGLTKHDDPAKIEQDLMSLLPQAEWTQFSHGLVYHGRAVCVARGPKCSACVLSDLCPFPGSREGRKVAR